jgi:ankyrin repeat protein
MLLVNNAKVNATDKWGSTALIKAAKNGHLETARFLLDAGADANAQETNGWNALREAAWLGHTDMVALLLTKVDPTKVSAAKDPNWASLRDAQTPAPALDDALVAATGGRGTADIVRMLIEKGGDVNTRNATDGASILFMAARSGAKDVVKLLLEKGADPELQNFHRMSAIGMGGDPEIMKMIKDAVEAKKPPVAPPPAPQPPTLP